MTHPVNVHKWCVGYSGSYVMYVNTIHVSLGIEKMTLSSSPVTKQLYINIRSSKKLHNPWWGPAGRCEAQLGAFQVYRIVCLCPTPKWLAIWNAEELYILSADEQLLSTQCGCHWVLWHTGSHSIIIIFIISNFISLYPEKDQVEPFLGCHYANLPIRSLGFLELFSNFPSSVFGSLSWGPASRLTIMRTIWSEWTQAWWPPWESLVLCFFGCLSWGPASCLSRFSFFSLLIQILFNWLFQFNKIIWFVCN